MRCLPALTVGLVAIIAAPAFSWISAENQRIDRALYPEHGPRAVLAGTIRKVIDRGPEDEVRLGPPNSEIQFEIEQVVIGSGAKVAPACATPRARSAGRRRCCPSRPTGGASWSSTPGSKTASTAV